MDKSESFSVFLMVALLAFAVVLVEERLLRTAVAVLPALWLSQRALEHQSLKSAPAPGPASERRNDPQVRAHVDRLLKYVRELYTTCHLMATEVISAQAAEERANEIEKELNRLMADITQASRAQGGPSE